MFLFLNYVNDISSFFFFYIELLLLQAPTYRTFQNALLYPKRVCDDFNPFSPSAFNSENSEHDLINLLVRKKTHEKILIVSDAQTTHLSIGLTIMMMRICRPKFELSRLTLMCSLMLFGSLLTRSKSAMLEVLVEILLWKQH